MFSIIRIEELSPTSGSNDGCIVVPFTPDRSRLLATARRVAGSARGYDVVVVTPRRSFLLHWRLERRSTGNLVIVTSPEPLRHGLSLGRIAQCWATVIVGNAMDSLSAEGIRQLSTTANRCPDAGMVASSSSTSVHGQVFRVHPGSVLIRRSALNVCGGIDESFSDLRDVLDELAGRFTKASIPIAAVASGDRARVPVSDIPAQRYPWLTIESESLPNLPAPSSGYKQSRSGIRPSRRINLLIDLTPVTRLSNGTGQHALRTLRALSTLTDTELTARLDPGTDRSLSAVCASLGIDILIGSSAVTQTFDAAFRVAQFDTVAEVSELRRLAPKVIVNHLDFIAFDNPTYHPSVDHWVTYRREVLGALHSVDGVAWLSNEVQQQAAAYGVRLPETLSAVCGAIAELGHDGGGTVPTDGPYIASFGASYHHKGRLYALRVFEECVRLGWPGQLVLAGWDPPHGSSRPEEEDLIAGSPFLRSRVIRVGSLSDLDHHATVRAASALLQPSLVEGFGLLAAEAAQLGVPTVMLKRSALREVYPPDYPHWLTGDDIRSDATVVLAATSNREAMTGHRVLSSGASDDPYRHYADRVVRLVDAVMVSGV